MFLGRRIEQDGHSIKNKKNLVGKITGIKKKFHL